MQIEAITALNIVPLVSLMLELWPDCVYEEERVNCQRILHSDTETCFLVKDAEQYVGFIYLSLRSEYVAGAISSPIAYIEGIYLRPDYRKTGIGRQLVEMGEDWARAKGCIQYASDTELGNAISIRFHQKVGFGIAERVVCFIKNID